MKSKEYISLNQLIKMVIGYLLGTSIIIEVGIAKAGKSVWISHLIAMFFCAVTLYMMHYIVNKSEYDDFGETLNNLFSKLVAKAILVYAFLFCLILSALILNNVGEFINLMVIQHSGLWTYIITMAIATAIVVRMGIEVVARSNEIVITFSIYLFIIILIVLTTLMDWKSFLPFQIKNIKDITSATISLISFPYIEIMPITFIMFKIRKEKRTVMYKILLKGLFISGFLLIMGSMYTIGVFGEEEAGRLVFPTYELVRMINFGEFVQRTELIIFSVWFFCVFAKLSICIYGAAKSLQELLDLEEYKELVIPIATLASAIGIKAYGNYKEILVLTSTSWPLIIIFSFIILTSIFLKTYMKNHE